MSVLKLKCVDQVLTILTTPLIASGAKEVNEVSCEFDSTWNNFGKTAVFYREESKAYHVVMANNICKIPQEVLVNDGTLYLGLFGVNGNQRKTTNVLRYKVVKGAIIDGIVPQEPTPQIYEQILSVYGQVIAKYENIFTDINKVVADAVLQGVVNQNNPNELCKFWLGSKVDYDKITTKEPNTMYYVIDDNTEVFHTVDSGNEKEKNVTLKNNDGLTLFPKTKVENIINDRGVSINLISLKTLPVNVKNGIIELTDALQNILDIRTHTFSDGATLTTIHNFRTTYNQAIGGGQTFKIEILDSAFTTYSGGATIVYLGE